MKDTKEKVKESNDKDERILTGNNFFIDLIGTQIESKFTEGKLNFIHHEFKDSCGWGSTVYFKAANTVKKLSHDFLTLGISMLFRKPYVLRFLVDGIKEDDAKELCELSKKGKCNTLGEIHTFVSSRNYLVDKWEKINNIGPKYVNIRINYK